MAKEPNETQEPSTGNNAAQPALAAPESLPVTPQNREGGNAKTPKPDSNPEDATAIARELHWLEKVNIFGQMGLVAVGIVAASIYGCQLGVMKGQLTQMQGSSKQTDNLLCMYQRQLAQMQRQSLSMQDSAAAAINQTNVITQSQLARFVFEKGTGVIKTGEPIRFVPFEIRNAGNTDAFKVDISIVAVFIPTADDPDFSYSRKDVASMDGPRWPAFTSMSEII